MAFLYYNDKKLTLSIKIDRKHGRSCTGIRKMLLHPQERMEQRPI